MIEQVTETLTVEKIRELKFAIESRYRRRTTVSEWVHGQNMGDCVCDLCEALKHTLRELS